MAGLYYIKPNQPGLGAHICNCGYIVGESLRGRGIGRALCEHSQTQAAALGYRAMQYNLVVSANAAAVHLWKKCGFAIIGAVPQAFNYKRREFVDAYIMYKKLSAAAAAKKEN